MSGFFIGRQPVFTSRLKVFGYELRGQPARVNAVADAAGGIDAPESEIESTNSVLKYFAEIGLDTMVHNLWALYRFPSDYLTGDHSLHFSSSRMMVEIPPDQAGDENFKNALVDLEAAGFKIILDDVTSYESVEPLVRPGRMVKINISGMIRPEIAWLSTRFKNSEVRLLAKGVHTIDDLEFCNRLGFTLYQGSFLHNPNVAGSGKIDSSRVTVLRALAVTADENSDFVQLEHIISQDITITYKLLRMVNSVYYATNDTIKSLQQAISMIGRDQLRGWITLILMSTVDDKPSELTGSAVIRAKMCELLARSMGQKNIEEFFLIGLLSVIDALMDLPMEEVIEKLCLSKDLVDGLLYQKGLLGRVLSTVQQYENGEWEKLSGNSIDPQDVTQAYIDSIRWSGAIVNSMK